MKRRLFFAGAAAVPAVALPAIAAPMVEMAEADIAMLPPLNYVVYPGIKSLRAYVWENNALLRSMYADGSKLNRKFGIGALLSDEEWAKRDLDWEDDEDDA